MASISAIYRRPNWLNSCGHVVPILQRRGLYRTEYQGRTLRSHYREGMCRLARFAQSERMGKEPRPGLGAFRNGRAALPHVLWLWAIVASSR